MNIERLNKTDLVAHCKTIGIDVTKKGKSELLTEAKQYRVNEIKTHIEQGNGETFLFSKIDTLAQEYASNLKVKIDGRKEEMEEDDNSHYLIYRVLGISETEGKSIDVYQNTGRFLYKYAGSFLEEAASLCLEFNNTDGGKTLIENNQGQRPKTFEIDFLNDNDAIEIKWRDATTDGDHITKEHTRVKCIQSQGYKPIRVMFYYPQRTQAKRIQETLKTIYTGVGGDYYAGEDAWDFIKDFSGYDLKAILTTIANNRIPVNGN
jgi:hypothetical protein